MNCTKDSQAPSIQKITAIASTRKQTILISTIIAQLLNDRTLLNCGLTLGIKGPLFCGKSLIIDAMISALSDEHLTLNVPISDRCILESYPDQAIQHPVQKGFIINNFLTDIKFQNFSDAPSQKIQSMKDKNTLSFFSCNHTKNSITSIFNETYSDIIIDLFHSGTNTLQWDIYISPRFPHRIIENVFTMIEKMHEIPQELLKGEIISLREKRLHTFPP